MVQLRVALTGGIGSGKTTVSDRFGELGAVVIDADLLAREAVSVGSTGLAEVRERFGADVIAADGALDRARLGQVVFADPAARRDLEAIVHPRVRQAAARRAAAAPADAVIVQVIPLLVETGQQGDFDLVVVVDVDPALQSARLQDRGLSPQEAQGRIAAQADPAVRRAAADVVIDNSGSRARLLAQVDALWAEWTRRSDP